MTDAPFSLTFPFQAGEDLDRRRALPRRPVGDRPLHLVLHPVPLGGQADRGAGAPGRPSFLFLGI